jgi:hypothetical protein
MKLKLNKKSGLKFIKMTASLSVIFVQFISNIGTALALPADIEELKAGYIEKIGQDPISFCGENLSAAYDIELAEFLEFLEGNFQNKSSNTSLVNIAIARFSEYKKNLNILFNTLNPSAAISGMGGITANTTANELLAYDNCLGLKEFYLDAAKQKMIDHIKTNTAQKKTAIFVEKYQAINSRLRDLNLAIAKMYGFFMTFKEKLPFFIEQCIVSK